MDDRTRVLIYLGASTAANCIPCFQYYFAKAMEVGITSEEVQESVDVAVKVKSGAQITMKNFIRGIIEGDEEQSEPCEMQAVPLCCG